MATINTESEKRAYQTFLAAGMTTAGACALIGNLEAESDGFYPNRVEYLCLKRLKENGKEYTDETYTAAIDSGALSCEDFLHPLPGKQYGYGLAQWTSPGRKSGLWSAAKQQGVSIADEGMQLGYLLQELEASYSDVLQVLKTATSIRTASDVVLKKFESPADTGESVCASRAARGQKFYDEYAAAGAAEEETEDMWEKTKALLDEQVGYLEKKSASELDSKTGNAGYANYTKYARDVNNWGLMGCQGQPWCAVYQFWICAKIFGTKKALEIMGNGFYNCNSIKSHAKAKGTWHTAPKLGAFVIFRNGAHVGRVIKVTDSMIYTNEGNTSSGKSNTVEANGGCVAEKSYTIGNSQIDGYVWIDYGTETSEQNQGESALWKATGTATSTVDNLFVRADPNGEVIGELMQGNRFEVNGVTSGKWTQVNVANIGVGWVWTAYVQHDGQTNTTTTIKNKQDQTERLFVGKVKATSLNVRTWAGTEYPQIKSYPRLAKGNLVDVMNYTQTASDGSKWYFVRIADQYHGFVCADYIERV